MFLCFCLVIWPEDSRKLVDENVTKKSFTFLDNATLSNENVAGDNLTLEEDSDSVKCEKGCYGNITRVFESSVRPSSRNGVCDDGN